MKSSTIITAIAFLAQAAYGAAIPVVDVDRRWVSYIAYDDVKDDSTAVEAAKDRRWVSYIAYDDVKENSAAIEAAISKDRRWVSYIAYDDVKEVVANEDTTATS